MSLNKHKARMRQLTTAALGLQTSSSKLNRCTSIPTGCTITESQSIAYEGSSQKGQPYGYKQMLASSARTYDAIPATCGEFAQLSILAKTRFPLRDLYSERPGDPEAPELELEDSCIYLPAVAGRRWTGPSSSELKIQKEQAAMAVLSGISSQTTPSTNHLRNAIELRDTKNTMGTLTDFVKFLKEVRKNPMRVARRFKGWRGIRTNLRTMAGLYLEWNWGVKPTAQAIRDFINDCTRGVLKVSGIPAKTFKKGSTVKASYRCRTRNADLLELAFPKGPSWNTGLKEHWFYRDLGGEINGWTFWDDPEIPPCYSVEEEWYEGTIFAEVTQDLTIPGLQDLANRFHWACPVARSLWEVTPFSFLTDWAIGVADYIERLERRQSAAVSALKLGPLWDCQSRRSVTWRPVLSKAAVAHEPLKPRNYGTRFGGALLGFSGEFALKQIESGKTVTRQPYRLLDVPLPQFKRSIKSYQITSSMALLVSNFA